MLLLAKANEIIDFVIMASLASSQMYAFACQGALHHGFFLQWQAPKSVRLLATAIAIIGFSYIGKLSNLCFCLPRQTKSLICLTLANSQIYVLFAMSNDNLDFSHTGKLSNLCFCLPTQTNSLIFPTSANSQPISFCLPGHTKSLMISSQW